MAKVLNMRDDSAYIAAVKHLARAVRAVGCEDARLWLDPMHAVRFWKEFLIPTGQEGNVKLSRAGFWRSVRGTFDLNGVTFEWDWEDMLNAMRADR